VTAPLGSAHDERERESEKPIVEIEALNFPDFYFYSFITIIIIIIIIITIIIIIIIIIIDNNY